MGKRMCNRIKIEFKLETDQSTVLRIFIKPQADSDDYVELCITHTL